MNFSYLFGGATPMMGSGYTGGNYNSGGLFNATDFLGNAGLGKSQMAMAAGTPGYSGGGSLPTSGLSPNYGAAMGGASAGFDMSKLAGLLGGMSGGGQAPATQVSNQGKSGSALDPMYLMKYASQAQNTKLMPLGLLG